MKIEDVTKDSFIFSFIGLLFFISPGIALIFTQRPDMFANLDWIKLLFLAVAIVLPTAVLLLFIVAFKLSNKGSASEMYLDFSMCLIINGLAIYLILILNFLLDLRIIYGFYGYAFLLLVYFFYKMIKSRKHDDK